MKFHIYDFQSRVKIHNFLEQFYVSLQLLHGINNITKALWRIGLASSRYWYVWVKKKCEMKVFRMVVENFYIFLDRLSCYSSVLAKSSSENMKYFIMYI
jgi:hypothetical protein